MVQSVQDEAPVLAAYLPAAQSVQTRTLAAEENLPTEQSRHASEALA
jgi:hypothetical protein